MMSLCFTTLHKGIPMNRNLTLVTLLASTIVSQIYCDPIKPEDPLKTAIEKQDVKTTQWLVTISQNIQLSQAQKDAYIQLADAQVAHCKLAHETSSIGAIVAELEKSKKIGTFGTGLTVLGGALIIGYWIHGFGSPKLGLTKEEAVAKYKEEYKSTAAALIGVGTMLKGLSDLVETFGEQKFKKKLKDAQAIRSYLELLQVTQTAH
jgi:hypothetical protein